MPTVPELPSIKAVLKIPEDYGVDLSPEEAAQYRGMMGGAIKSYRRLEELVEPTLPVKYPRDGSFDCSSSNTWIFEGANLPLRHLWNDA